MRQATGLGSGSSVRRMAYAAVGRGSTLIPRPRARPASAAGIRRASAVPQSAPCRPALTPHCLILTGFPVVNDPLYNHVVFGPNKGKGGLIGKADDELIRDLVNIHNAENWLGMDGDSDLSMFKPLARELDEDKG